MSQPLLIAGDTGWELSQGSHGTCCGPLAPRREASRELPSPPRRPACPAHLAPTPTVLLLHAGGLQWPTRGPAQVTKVS